MIPADGAAASAPRRRIDNVLRAICVIVGLLLPDPWYRRQAHCASERQHRKCEAGYRTSYRRWEWADYPASV